MRTSTAPPLGSRSRPWIQATWRWWRCCLDLRALSTTAVTETFPWVWTLTTCLRCSSVLATMTSSPSRLTMAATPSLSCLRAPVCTPFFFFSFNFHFHLWVFVFSSANSSCCLNFFRKKSFFFWFCVWLQWKLNLGYSCCLIIVKLFSLKLIEPLWIPNTGLEICVYTYNCFHNLLM